MKVLLDSCVWGKAAEQLRNAGHDVVWVGDWPRDPGDEAILAEAHADQRILITIDKDFGELAVRRQRPHCGIVRIVNFAARQQADAIAAVLAAHGNSLLAGALVTVQPGYVRVRLADG